MPNPVGRPRKKFDPHREPKMLERFKQEFYKVNILYQREALRIFDGHGIKTALRYLKFVQEPITTKARYRG